MIDSWLHIGPKKAASAARARLAMTAGLTLLTTSVMGQAKPNSVQIYTELNKLRREYFQNISSSTDPKFKDLSVAAQATYADTVATVKVAQTLSNRERGKGLDDVITTIDRTNDINGILGGREPVIDSKTRDILGATNDIIRQQQDKPPNVMAILEGAARDVLENCADSDAANATRVYLAVMTTKNLIPHGIGQINDETAETYAITGTFKADGRRYQISDIAKQMNSIFNPSYLEMGQPVSLEDITKYFSYAPKINDAMRARKRNQLGLPFSDSKAPPATLAFHH